MRVHVPGIEDPTSPPEGFYWRGVALDHYTGRTWSNTLGLERWRRPKRREGGLLKQVVTIEPTFLSRVIFGAHEIRDIDGVSWGIECDGNGNYYALEKAPYPYAYTVYSDTGGEAKRDVRSLKRGLRNLFLRLPDRTLDADRIAEEAQRILEVKGFSESQLDEHDEPVALKKAKAIESHLVTSPRYRYSLNLGADPSKAPLEEFLFERRPGTCYYYATAMVVMLRTLGIPARIVNGFMTGEWNEYGSYWAIRQSDAHSWVEAFVDGRGWVAFDPTPRSQVRYSRRGLVGSAQRFWDALAARWNRYVLNFRGSDQIAIYGWVAQLVVSVTSLAAGTADRLEASGLWLIVLFLAVVLAAATYFWAPLWRQLPDLWRQSRAARLPPSARVAVGFYRRLTAVLRRKGFRREQAQTPGEFAETVIADGGEAFAPVRAITELYYRARFGREALTQEERGQVQGWLVELRRASAVPKAQHDY